MGDVVTFSYTKFTPSGRPANPSGFKIRRDVKWEQVVDDFINSVPRSLPENGTSAHTYEEYTIIIILLL